MFCLDQLKEPQCVSNSCFFRHRITQVDRSQSVPRIDTNSENSYKLFLEFVKETVKKQYINHLLTKKKTVIFCPQKWLVVYFFSNETSFLWCIFSGIKPPHTNPMKKSVIPDPRCVTSSFVVCVRHFLPNAMRFWMSTGAWYGWY